MGDGLGDGPGAPPTVYTCLSFVLFGFVVLFWVALDFLTGSLVWSLLLAFTALVAWVVYSLKGREAADRLLGVPPKKPGDPVIAGFVCQFLLPVIFLILPFGALVWYIGSRR